MGYLLVLLGIINKCVQDIVPDPQEVCIVTSTYSAPVILLCPEDNYLSCIAHHALLHSLVSPALPCNVPCLSSPLSPVSPWSTRKNPLHCPPSMTLQPHFALKHTFICHSFLNSNKISSVKTNLKLLFSFCSHYNLSTTIWLMEILLCERLSPES